VLASADQALAARGEVVAQGAGRGDARRQASDSAAGAQRLAQAGKKEDLTVMV
jgi:hypothetical protein